MREIELPEISEAELAELKYANSRQSLLAQLA
jgi:hypothetical protein